MRPGSGASQADQLALDGFDVAPRPTDRLFFALYPPSEVAQEVAGRAEAWRASRSAKGHMVAAERLHVTLQHVGDHAGLPAGVVDAALVAGEAVKAARFELTLDCLQRFSGKQLVLRPAAGTDWQPLKELHEALEQSMRRHGLGRWAKPEITPHVTLMYDAPEQPDTVVAPMSWPVQEFVLVHSLLGRSVHRLLCRWPLQP